MFQNRLKEFRERRGMSQTRLAEELGVSRSTVSMYESGGRKPSFEALEAIARALRVSFNDLMGVDEQAYRMGLSAPGFRTRVPRLGRISCGTPILAEENVEAYDPVPDGIDCDYTLVCEGDSMAGARIMDGDVVYIKAVEALENGQIAAVRVGDETTLKRFYRSGDTVTLMPENPKYPPLVFTGRQIGELRIVGRAVAFTSAVR